MKAVGVLLLSILIAWTPFILPVAFGGEAEGNQSSGSGSIWQEIKEDWVEIGKETKDAGIEVGKSIKKEFQEFPENMRKGYHDAKESFENGGSGHTEDTSSEHKQGER